MASKINKLIPAHKKMAMGGKPYKKGGVVKAPKGNTKKGCK